MQYGSFFSEIYESHIISTRNGLQKYIPYIKAHREGNILEFPELPKLTMSFFDIDKGMIQNAGQKPENSVAIIPVNGMMTRSGSWWDYGTDDYAELLKQAYDDPAIKAVLLRINTVGGTVDSAFPINEALKNRNKPVLSAIDSKCYSMGYYVACQTDDIKAVDGMAGLGSIGIMSRLQNSDAYLKKEYGIEIIEVYPPESQWKNKAEREALAGNPDLLISEVLSPWAQHFQEMVKNNRKKLDMEVEGLLEGRTFFAKDCTPDKNGLIDGIMPFGQIVKYAADYDRNNKLNSFFK